MAVARRKLGFSWMWFILLSGLSMLSWISTYTGIMELITASTGYVGLLPQIAVGFAVFMLQLMILYVLDAMFSGTMRWWLWPPYIVGYVILFMISVGFAFGFYWKYLEAGSVTTASAEQSLREVQQTLELGTTRLTQMQSTFTTLAQISSEKAERERTVGRTCPGSPPGDGPRRRLRDADAERFQFASRSIDSRIADVRTDIDLLNDDLRKLLTKDPSTIDPETGSRREYIGNMNRRLSLVATRFNALRSDPQLLQLRDEFATRAEQAKFPDGRGGTFICPDPQLQTAINGVVRAINELPVLEPPLLTAYEGSEAVIEAFRRLTNSSLNNVDQLGAALQNGLNAIGIAPAAAPVPDAPDGLSDRDLIPLMIAIFVDICILLVSVNRPFGPFFELSRSMDAARRGAMNDYLETFYKVFQDQFDPGMRPTATEVIAPIQDVVFDHKGRYYAAVPLDFREEDYMKWLERRKGPGAAKAIFQATSEKPLEESRYITGVFATLEGSGFVVLIDAADDGLDFALIKQKLGQQGSVYAQADAFRLYRFKDKAWAQILIQSVASGAAQSERMAQQRAKSGEHWERRMRIQPPKDDGSYRGEVKPVSGDVNKQITEHVSDREALVDHSDHSTDQTATFDDDPDINDYTDASNFKKDGDSSEG